jgi:integrase
MMTSAALQPIPGGREPARDAEAEFAFDTWHADRLGIVRRRSPTKIHFEPIGQLWLRETVKRWAKFRLGTGASFGTLCSEAQAMGWFSRFLTEQHPEVVGGAGLTRRLLEHYLSWLASSTLGESTRRTYLGFLHNFLESCRRHSWLAGLPPDANIYFDELLRRPRPAPRFIDEFVMAQLEDPANLVRLPDDTTRHLVVLLIETGLRSSDALNLPFNPLLADSAGWPCLRYYNAKIAEDQLIPLSPSAAETIRAQQAHLRDRSPDRDLTWLFPRPRGDPAAAKPFSYHTFRDRLTAWQQAIGLHDEAGAPVHVTAHQFRHTLGTRMINDGVPQHVIQRLLGHTTAQMTARYAHIHDTTLREAFDDYQRRRVDISGQRLAYDPIATTADAEWIKHNLARIAASLPNGYCGRPPQQDCPHPNACLTCPDFQTTPEFLPLHRRQRDDTLVLLTAAEQAGKTRLAETHRQVASNIGHIIDALEAIEQEPTPDAR